MGLRDGVGKHSVRSSTTDLPVLRAINDNSYES